ncbi:MAG: aminotransferase class I/II-fold pyridoxal phosphate-dependent enzyme, partial [Rhodosalinus sp.]
MRNSRRGEVDPFIVMDVMEAARAAEAAGRHVIHMEVGQPGTPAPAAARAALARAMEEHALGYTVALGLPELRARIARLYGDWYGVDLDPARVVVTAGSSGAFILAFTALFDAGEKVGIGAPGYPSYRQILRALDLAPVDIPTDPANRYQPVPGELAGQGLSGLLVASPANPTGTMLGREDLAALIGWAEAEGAAFVSDEIYHGIEYEAKAVTALELSDQVYVINSFSKYFSMTGWRVGWMVVP